MSSGSNFCPQCGSRRFRRDRTGVIVCDEGHVYQGYRVEESNLTEGEGVRHVLTRRILRKLRDKKGRRKKVGHIDPNIFQGDEKHYVRLELLQLLLRQLVRCATEEWNLPQQVESYARELWALLLSLHPLPPAPAIAPPTKAGTLLPRPLFEAKPSRLAFAASQPLPGRHGSRRNRQASPDPEDMALASDDKTDGESDSDKSDVGETWKEEGVGSGPATDDEIDDESVLEELAALSGSSAGSSASRQDRVGETRKAEKSFHLKGSRRTKLNWGSGKRPHKITPQMVLGIFIMALHMVRVPIMIVHVLRAIDNGVLPYVDFGRSKYVPANMRVHLTRELQGAGTWARRTPSMKGVCVTLRLLADDLEKNFRLRIPDINASPVLWHLVEGLGGCPTIYLYSIELLRLCKLHLSLSRPADIAAETERGYRWNGRKTPGATASGEEETEGATSDGESESHDGRRKPKRVGVSATYGAEVGMVMAVVMALKLAYGLDGKSRPITAPSDSGLGLPSVSTWRSAFRARVAVWKSTFEVNIMPRDFIFAEADEMDCFLAQAERALLSHQSSTDDKRMMEDMFPLGPPAEFSRDPAAKTAVGQAPVSYQTGYQLEGEFESDSLEPGERYDLSYPSGAAEVGELIKAASALVGVDTDALSSELANFERQFLSEWRRRALLLKRRGKGPLPRKPKLDRDDAMNTD